MWYTYLGTDEECPELVQGLLNTQLWYLGTDEKCPVHRSVVNLRGLLEIQISVIDCSDTIYILDRNITAELVFIYHYSTS